MKIAGDAADHGVPAAQGGGRNAEAAVRDGEEAAGDAEEDDRRDGQVRSEHAIVSKPALQLHFDRDAYA